MDEQPRPESAANERDPATSEPAATPPPSGPAETAPIPNRPNSPDGLSWQAPAAQPGEVLPASDAASDAPSDAPADLRFHPWQAFGPASAAEPAKPVTPGEWERRASIAEQETAAPLAGEMQPEPEREWERTPVHAMAAQADPDGPHPVAASALPLFTAATVPPDPRDDRPAIPVDPSAETVPLNSRTNEMPAAGRAYPGYPGFPGSPRAGGRPSGFAALGQPLSRDAAVRFLTAACATIVLAAVLGLLFTRGEWATGLAAAGIAALLVAGAYLVGTVVRAIPSPRKGSVLRLGLLAAILFGLLGEAGLWFNASLHQVQAGVLASIGDYGGAVREYRLAGVQPPNPDLARAYVGWGNTFLHQHDYADAAASFQTVIEQFASTSVVPQAASGLLTAYDGWMSGASLSLPYETILRDLGTVSQAPYCERACAAQAAQLTARAHVDFGRALNARGAFPLAIAQFEAVTSPSAPSAYVAQAHEDAAVTYYTYGQSQRYADGGKSCSNAVPAFQRLVSAYGDTPEGATAKAALAAHVQVRGSVTGYPKNPQPTVYLSKTIRSNTFFSDDYSATLDSHGNFTFTNVAPGSYNLSAAVPNGAGVYWVDPATHSPYGISVGPLCDLSLQPYPYS